MVYIPKKTEACPLCQRQAKQTKLEHQGCSRYGCKYECECGATFKTHGGLVVNVSKPKVGILADVRAYRRRI